jgi:hypothetical protein
VLVRSDLTHRLQSAVVKQIRKQRPVVQHGLAKFFHPDVFAFMARRNVMRQPVVLGHRRMID